MTTRGMEMETTINSRILGKKVTFFIGNDGGGYVFTDLFNGRSGTLGKQICHGGSTLGETIEADEHGLSAVARRWFRQYMADDAQRFEMQNFLENERGEK